jgi:hypothetical protein
MECRFLATSAARMIANTLSRLIPKRFHIINLPHAHEPLAVISHNMLSPQQPRGIRHCSAQKIVTREFEGS